jgi:hypothetical protein
MLSEDQVFLLQLTRMRVEPSLSRLCEMAMWLAALRELGLPVGTAGQDFGAVTIR